MSNSPEPDLLFVTMNLGDRRPTLPEISEALDTIDSARALSYQLTQVEVVLSNLDQVAMEIQRAESPKLLASLVRNSDIADLRDGLGMSETVPRPDATVSRQSPLTVELTEWIAPAIGSLASLGVWQAFKYLVANAEHISGLPHRLRLGWHTARADSDEARVRAMMARRRLELQQLEQARAAEIQSVARELRRLGPIEIDSNFPDEPSFWR